MAKLNKNKVNDLKKFFNIGVNPSAKISVDKIFPTVKDPANNDKVVREKFPSHVEELYKLYQSSTYKKADSWKNRMELFSDMKEMYLNDPIMSYAINLIVSEVLGSVENRGNPLTVKAKRKVRKDIMELFDIINIKENLPQIVKNLVLTGNSGLVIDVGNNGVTGAVCVSPEDITDRIEFNANRIKKEMDTQGSVVSKLRGIQRSDMMLKSIVDNENSLSYFKDYLLGFQIGEQLLPPWRFIHFRSGMDFSEFKPYGTPMYIHALSPSKQFQYAMTLQGIARGLMFPTDVFKLTVAEKSHPTDKLLSVVELMNELQNSGMGTVKKEQDGIGRTIYTVEGLYEWEQQASEIDLGKMGDIELLREDRFIATGIPRDLIDPSDSGFGDAGVALKEKFKPFGNIIFNLQTPILQGIDQIIKIHFILSNNYENINEVDYEIELPFPTVLQNDDLISQKGDLLTLANDVIDAFSDKFIEGDAVPPEIALEIYQLFFPVDDTKMEDWYKKMIKMKDAGETEPESDEAVEEKEPVEESFKKSWRLIEQNVGRKPSSIMESIQDTYLEVNNEFLREGINSGRHFYTSSNKCLDFDVNKLQEWKVEIVSDEYKQRLYESKNEYLQVDEIKCHLPEIKETSKDGKSYGISEKGTSKKEYGIVEK